MKKVLIRKKEKNEEEVKTSKSILPKGKSKTIENLNDLSERERKSKDDGSLLARIEKSSQPRYESWSDDINEVALRIAEIFPYDDILVAWDPKQAPHIHGWLQDHYRNFQWLIDNYVMEVASWYAKNKLESKIKFVKVVTGIEIEKYKISRMDLKRLHRLDNYPNQPYISVIFLSEEYIDDAVYWLEDAEWIIDNEDVRVNLGRFGGNLIAWESWNVPVILVTYLPFRNQGIYKAQIEANQIVKLQDDLRLKLIHTYRTRVDTLEAKVDEKEREAKQWKKMYSDSNKDITLLVRRELERRGYVKNKINTTRFGGVNILLVFLLAIFAILTIVGFVL